MDTLTPEHRSWLMSRIRSVDTKPEMFVRAVLHRAGYRYGLHCGDLPGRPDVVLRARGLAIEVRGCFWHHHPGCHGATIPHSRHAWWVAKLRRNASRDARHVQELLGAGWKLLVVWECFLAGSSPAAREAQARVLLGRVAALDAAARRRVDVLSAADAAAPGRASRRPLLSERAALDALLDPGTGIR